jgi:hypothetical protein
VFRAGPGAWRGLGPIVQTQTMSTIDPQFQDGLAAWRDPSFLAPLGHHVVPGAPSGSVAGLAVAAPRTLPSPPRMPPPQISYDDGWAAEAQSAGDPSGPSDAAHTRNAAVDRLARHHPAAADLRRA